MPKLALFRCGLTLGKDGGADSGGGVLWQLGIDIIRTYNIYDIGFWR